jgi:putative transposase
MRKSRFTHEQIFQILRERDAGMKTAEICDRHGISRSTFYGWRARYGGLSESGAKRLKQIEGENGKLRRNLAQTLLENAVLRNGCQMVTNSGAEDKF